MAEHSESPSRNGHSTGFPHLWPKTKSKKGRSSFSDSIRSNASDGHPSVRESLESVIDKIKGDDEDVIKKLVPKRLGSKRRRKKQEKEEEERVREEAARGRSVAERGTLENETDADASHVYFSTEQRDRSRAGSSLITYDSDTESPLETPPPLTTHPSHAGYLTTSSPLVHLTTLDSQPQSQLDGPATPRAATFHVTSSNLAASTSSSSLGSSTLKAPTDASQKRSPSPVGRLRNALTRRGSSPNTSPERRPSPGTQIKDTTTNDRRGSVATKIGSIFPDQQVSSSDSILAPERPRTANVQPIDTSRTPLTPSQADVAPAIVNTPPTPVETSTPRFPSSGRGSPDSTSSNSNVVTSASGNMISHRRVRSTTSSLGPSKLSNITSAPLTPTLENSSATPSGGGFFSSVFSAAQNAANTLSNSIGNTSVAPGGTRNKSVPQEIHEPESPEVEVETLDEKQNLENQSEPKEPAVNTLGMGDLSLSHLGISEPNSGTTTPTAAKAPDHVRGRSESMNDDLYSAHTTVVADSVDIQSATEIEDSQTIVRPRSMYEHARGGEQTPPNGSVFEGKSGIHRSGSIRSAIGHHRKRGSSAATTGTTIAAAIAAANASVAHPNQSNAPKLTGFAVASKKRNRDFHQLFRSVPDDDYLIEDYSCALQREILAHGRLYVSEGHLCFSSNIFGWVTTLVMSFDEIVSVEKRSTALLFKNGLMISTLHAKNVFASFTSRDSTYDLIVGIWKLGHPSLRSSLNGVRIDETGGGDKTEKDDGDGITGSQSGSGSESEGEEGDDIYDEDEEEDDDLSFAQGDGSVVGSEDGDKVASRKPSAAVITSASPAEKGKEDPTSTSTGDFPGPTTHAPTDCSDQETHYSKVLADETIAAPLGKVYNLLFGPASVAWMRNWLTGEQKCLEFTSEDKKGLIQDNKTRSYSYIKPLNGAIGPKQTKCLLTENLDSLDLEKAVSVTITTQTPDVPSGNVFSIKTRYCLTWAEGNTTRIQMNCAIEWTGKSWLKGPIEKGANDGQTQYAKDIIASLRAAVSSRRGTPAVVVTSGKGKKKGRKGRESKSINRATDGASDSKPAAENWGLFEPMRGILSPIVDILKPVLTGNILYGLLVGLLVASWFRFGFSGKGSNSSDVGGFFGTPERIAAYEEIWRREESELWDWLEERVGMERLREASKYPGERKNVEDKLKNEKMEERELDTAIRITEEKLKVLKDVVDKKKNDVKTSLASE